MSTLVSGAPEGNRTAAVLEQYHKVQSILAKAASLANRLQMMLLILSVLTSGSLWLAISNAVPQASLWVGAIASTLITGITLYIKTSGINKIRSKSLEVVHDLGQFLAEVSTSPDMPDVDYVRRYKEFESKIIELSLGHHGDDI